MNVCWQNGMNVCWRSGVGWLHLLNYFVYLKLLSFTLRCIFISKMNMYFDVRGRVMDDGLSVAEEVLNSFCRWDYRSLQEPSKAFYFKFLKKILNSVVVWKGVLENVKYLITLLRSDRIKDLCYFYILRSAGYKSHSEVGSPKPSIVYSNMTCLSLVNNKKWDDVLWGSSI